MPLFEGHCHRHGSCNWRCHHLYLKQKISVSKKNHTTFEVVMYQFHHHRHASCGIIIKVDTIFLKNQLVYKKKKKKKDTSF